jgi:hypothetical protein
MDPRFAVVPSQESFAVKRYFQANMDPRLLGIAADIGARPFEHLAVDVDPRCPRRVLCLAEDVGAVGYARS